MKIRLALALLVLLLTSGYALADDAYPVDPSAPRQTIRGWGVSLCWWANLAGAWPEAEIERVTDLLAVDLGYNVFRFNLGGGENPACPFGADHFRRDGGLMPGYLTGPPNPPIDLAADARQIAVLDALARKQPTILTVLFSNSPPWWMTRSRCAAGATNGGANLLPEFEDDFADYLASASAALRARNPAWNIRHLEPFNEPLSGWWKAGAKQEGCHVPAAQQAAVLAKLHDRLLARPVPNVTLVAPDCSEVSETRRVLAELRRDHPAALSWLAGIHTHSYQGTAREKRALADEAERAGLPVWQSETGPLSWQPKDGKSWWHRHYAIADRMLEDLRELRCEVWCDWQFLSTDDAWGLLRFTDFNENDPAAGRAYAKTRSYFMRKQVVNFIPPGYRILLTGPAHTLGALSADGHRLVVLVANPGAEAVAHHFDLARFPTPAAVRVYRTSGPDGGENLVESPPGAFSIEAQTLTCAAPAYSLTTIAIDFTVTTTLRSRLKHPIP
jgi:O-glycosyl hydrolase